MNGQTTQPRKPSERELFLEALSLGTAAERAAFLDRACAADPGLRQRVDRLLQQEQQLGTFLETPALAADQTPNRLQGFGPHGTAVSAVLTEKPGDNIGRYRLLQQIGEGGCGVVYMAEQQEPVRRRVALKVIKLGMDTRNIIARFEAERQALAMMDHPNIARVLDAGATETGRPFFVMELVRGIRITDYCDQHKLPTRDRLGLFSQVCHAVQHAHQKGIIHRDLKPSNILVTLLDGTPVPKVIDFGIAKATEQRLTDKTLFTEFTAFIGTPAYMSPEQAEMSSLDIDTRSDIYSLGVLLYELLTGHTPFDAESLMKSGIDACRRTIREQEPQRPSTRLSNMLQGELTTTATHRCTDAPKLISQLTGDLDWIVMRCLEKDRTRRYPTANALALDLQRYLDNEPVLARPPSATYRLRKLLRRHRLAVTAAAAIAVSLIGGASISTWLALRATHAEGQALQLKAEEAQLRVQAEQEKAAARLNEYIADMGLAQQSIATGNYGRAAQLLRKHLPTPGEPDLRGFEWRLLWQQSLGNPHSPLPNQPSTVLAVALSPDRRTAAIGLRESIVLQDLTTGTRAATLQRGAQFLVFHPQRPLLLSASRAAVRIWNTTNWTELHSLDRASGPLVLSPDGSLLATEAEGGVVLWHTDTWKPIGQLPQARGPIAFAPDGHTLAADSFEGVVLWSVPAGRILRVLENSTNLFLRAGHFFATAHGMAFSRDGRTLVAPRNTATDQGTFTLSRWDTASGQEIGSLPSEADRAEEHTSAIADLVLSPDGSTLASASFDHSIRLWDLSNRRALGALQGHRSEVWALDFSADGNYLLSGAKDGGVNLWPLHPPAPDEILPTGWTPLLFAANGRTLAALDPDANLAFVNLATHEAERTFDLGANLPRLREPPPPDGGMRPRFEGPRPERNRGRAPFDGPRFNPAPVFALSADLRVLAQAHPGTDNLRLLDTETGESTVLNTEGDRPDFLRLSPAGDVLVTAGRNQPLRWFEPRRNTNALLTLEGGMPLFTPDGSTLAILQPTNTVQLYKVATRNPTLRFTLDPAPGFALAFSPNGGILATTSGMEDFDNSIYLWNTSNGSLLRTCAGHKQPVIAIAFAPDGRTLASSGSDGTIRLWNTDTGQELLSVRHQGSFRATLLFSPDGQLLLSHRGSYSKDSSLRVLRAPALTEPPPAPPIRSSADTGAAPIPAASDTALHREKPPRSR